MNKLAKCPYCYELLKIGEGAKIRDLLTCHLCKREWEIVLLDPVELSWPLALSFRPKRKFYEDLEEDDVDYFRFS